MARRGRGARAARGRPPATRAPGSAPPRSRLRSAAPGPGTHWRRGGGSRLLLGGAFRGLRRSLAAPASAMAAPAAPGGAEQRARPGAHVRCASYRALASPQLAERAQSLRAPGCSDKGVGWEPLQRAVPVPAGAEGAAGLVLGTSMQLAAASAACLFQLAPVRRGKGLVCYCRGEQDLQKVPYLPDSKWQLPCPISHLIKTPYAILSVDVLLHESPEPWDCLLQVTLSLASPPRLPAST